MEHTLGGVYSVGHTLVGMFRMEHTLGGMLLVSFLATIHLFSSCNYFFF